MLPRFAFNYQHFWPHYTVKLLFFFFLFFKYKNSMLQNKLSHSLTVVRGWGMLCQNNFASGGKSIWECRAETHGWKIHKASKYIPLKWGGMMMKMCGFTYPNFRQRMVLSTKMRLITFSGKKSYKTRNLPCCALNINLFKFIVGFISSTLNVCIS